MHRKMRLCVLAGFCSLLMIQAIQAQTIQPAAPISRPPAAYPSEAAGREGSVVLRFTIDKTGHVKNAVPSEGAPPGIFEAAAVAAVSNWTYRPRTVDGQTVDQPNNEILMRFKPSSDQAPVWLNPSPPYYPVKALMAEAEGSVPIGYDIDEYGMVDNVHVVVGTSPGVFDEAAIYDVKNRVFQPRLINGRPAADPNLTTNVEFRLADAKLAPIPIKKDKPEYPADAALHRVIGYCVVDVTVAPDGAVSDAKVAMAFPSGVFEAASLAAVRKWKFLAAEDNGGPLVATAHYTFTYKMTDTPETGMHYLKPGQWVKLDFTLQTNGRAKDIVVIDQSNPDLPVSRAIDQVLGSRFQPATENGQPVEKQHQLITIH